MKKLIAYFIDFHQEYFHPRLYLNVFLFIAFLITFNYRFYFKILFNSYGLITITFVLLLFKFIFERKAGEGLYGLQLGKVDFKVYWIMLMGMVPIIYLSTKH